jgi:hypothetical protein
MTENTRNRPTRQGIRPGRDQGSRFFICGAVLRDVVWCETCGMSLDLENGMSSSRSRFTLTISDVLQPAVFEGARTLHHAQHISCPS